jgi:hypothetical protein
MPLRVPIVGKRAAEGNIVGIAAGGLLDEEVRFRYRPGFRVDLLTEQMNLRIPVDWGPNELAVFAQPDGDVLFGDQQHATRAAAGIVYRAHDPFPPDAVGVARQHEVNHQVHHVARREVFAGIFIQRFIELADQLLEDRAHRRVVDLVRMQVDVLESFEHLEKKPRLIERADGVIKVKLLQHLPHVRTEAGDMVAQICC